MSNGKTLLTSIIEKSLIPKKPTTTTWDQYKKWVIDKAKEGKAFWYRGQADATWTLKTTFHREADKTGINMLQYLTIVETDLHYQLCSRLNERIILEDQFEYASYLALLRNHGFPTPMLDWTLSPFVAAYFAFKECDKVKPACRQVRVFIFNCKLWTDTYLQPNSLRETGSYVSVIRPHAKYNPRQIAQNTVYTVTNVSNMGDYIDVGKKTEPFLYYFTLSADIKKEVMTELDLMGINEMTLFPDLDGLCRTMKTRYFGDK